LYSGPSGSSGHKSWGFFQGIFEPAIPEAVIGKPVLSGAGFKDFIPGFGPGKFVFDSGHGGWQSVY